MNVRRISFLSVTLSLSPPPSLFLCLKREGGGGNETEKGRNVHMTDDEEKRAVAVISMALCALSDSAGGVKLR